MSTMPVPIRSSAPAQAAPPKRKLTVRAAAPIKPRLLIHATEGFGKTTLGGFAPNPVILMARDERGVDRLLSSGRLPDLPAERIDSWPDLLGWCDSLASDPQGRETIVLDAAGGHERLCHEHVCATQFGGDWSETGFLSFHKGFELAVTEWLKLLQRLDALNRAGMTVILLAHSRVKSFKNPMGPDFDRFEPDCHAKTWAVTARWADAVFFGNFRSIVEIAGKKTGNIAKDKGKGIGGIQRVLYTERRDAYDAKNSYGMPPEMVLPDKYAESWSALWSAITANQVSPSR